MREPARTIPAAANRSLLPSSARGTFSRREKGKETAKTAEQALREANAATIP